LEIDAAERSLIRMLARRTGGILAADDLLPHEWFRLLSRSAFRTWDDDRLDSESVVRETLSEAHDPDEDTTDRVTALGNRVVPALRHELEAKKPVERCCVARPETGLVADRLAVKTRMGTPWAIPAPCGRSWDG
jgi:hypothetical protein